MTKDKQVRVKLARLYENTSKTGTTYLAGNLGGVRIVAFRSEYDDTGVVYDVYVQPRDEEKRKPASLVEGTSDKIPF